MGVAADEEEDRHDLEHPCDRPHTASEADWVGGRHSVRGQLEDGEDPMPDHDDDKREGTKEIYVVVTFRSGVHHCDASKIGSPGQTSLSRCIVSLRIGYKPR